MTKQNLAHNASAAAFLAAILASMAVLHAGASRGVTTVGGRRTRGTVAVVAELSARRTAEAKPSGIGKAGSGTVA